MLTSIRGLLAATVLAGSLLAAAPALAQDEEEGAESPISISGWSISPPSHSSPAIHRA